MVLPEGAEVVLHGLPDLVHGGVVVRAQLAVPPPALVQVLHLRGDHPRPLGLLRWRMIIRSKLSDQIYVADNFVRMARGCL